MILRGLLIAAAGFVFIFSPGLPLGLLSRRAPAINRGLMGWGLALWPAALIPALFLQSLLRQALEGSRPAGELAGRPEDYLVTLAGALITALIVQGAMALLFRLRRPGLAERLAAGLSLGIGIGLISQVFTGLGLVGAGFRLALGEARDPMVAALAKPSGWSLALSLAPLILFRPALLVVSAARGMLVARSIGEGARLWWAAVAIDALFAWAAIAIQLALGSDSPGLITAGGAAPLPATVTAAYYLAAFGLAYWWIAGRLEAKPGAAALTASRPSAAVR